MTLLNTVIDDEQFSINDDIIRISPLTDISNELLEETIKTQIENPYNAVTNCLEEFRESYSDELDEYEGDEEMIPMIHSSAKEFYVAVIDLIDKKFDLGVDFELIGELDIDSISNIAEAIYEFFIIKYSHNISKCIVKLILNNFDSIISYLSANKNTNASIISYKKKLQSKESAMVLSNINTAIGCVKTLELEPSDFINLFNIDKFEVAVIAYAIENNIINGNFIGNFLAPIVDRIQDEIYDEVVRDVQSYLYHKFKKNEKFDLNTIVKEAGKDDE
jgi:hypothetical protein